MKRSCVLSLGLGLALCAMTAMGQEWSMKPTQIPTRWAAAVNPAQALPEYPRPQLVRAQWQNLNGVWRYAITPKEALPPERYDGAILVPYPLESALSGVQKPLKPDQALWYQRTLTIAPGKKGERTLLHFGAVDFEATVYVNGQEAGSHSGGYQSFTLDITDKVKAGDNELTVKVFDPTDTGPNPHGKQSSRPQGIVYTASSGIWQTVWLETVPAVYIDGLKLTPDVDRNRVLLQVSVQGKLDGLTVEAVAKSGAAIVAQQPVKGPTALTIANPRLWSPDDPFLYDLEVRLLKKGKPVDQVQSYFGLRKIELKKDAAGIERIFLNGRYTYNLGVLDQGFWPDGLHTAPTDAALKFDIQAVKAMGFNTIRKHVKIEPERWYYHCDTLGVLVWQDMVPPSDGTEQAKAQFEKETKQNLAQLHNHPSITTWVLFNEGWGAYDQERLARWMKDQDPSRLLNGLSGGFDTLRFSQWKRHLEPAKLYKALTGDPNLEEVQALQHDSAGGGDAGDMIDLHHYPDPRIPAAQPGKIRVLGEYGGVGVRIDGHTWNDLVSGWGYVEVTPDKLARTYADMMDQLKALEAQGLSASIYTQPYDVEGEQNGLMTYDRAITKIPVTELAKLNGKLIPKTANTAAVTEGFTVADVDLTPQPLKYAALFSEYRKAQQDLPFLRQFALMAIREKDQVRATDAANEYIERSPRPYSADTWAFIAAVTRSSKDVGFNLLRTQTRQANEALGENAAERKLMEIIGREEIDPILANKAKAPKWPAIEKAVIAKYGPLGAEKVYGAEMVYYLGKQDWPNFGKYYALHFNTAMQRSEYLYDDSLAYRVFKHVADRNALEIAAKSVKFDIDKPSADDPVQMDTYAGLLYKAGRKEEALQWQERAVKLADGHDQELIENLRKMKGGEITW